MNILITGGCGFIGTHLVDELDKVEGLNIDVFDKNTLNLNRYKHYDLIIHAAALVNARESVENPLEYYENNINVTLKVLKLSFDKFIYLDSEMSLQPDNPYACSKAMCNKIIMDTLKGDYYRLVLSNVLGEDHISKTHILPCLLNDTFKLHNEGKDIRSYVDIRTVVSTVKNIILEPSQNKNLFLSDFKNISTLEFVETYNKTLNNQIITDNKLAKLGLVIKRILLHKKLK